MGSVRAVLCAGLLAVVAGGQPLPERWFFFSNSLPADADVSRFEELADTAAAHGYNGVCWSGGDSIFRWDAARLERLRRVRAIAAARNLAIVPLVFSVGYGGAALSFDPNLAVGFPVDGALYLVGDDRVARHQPTDAPQLANAGLDVFQGDRPVGWTFADKPGEISFADTTVRHAGAASLRFENPGARGLGPHARVMQRLQVSPRRQYRVRVWVRAEGLEPANLRLMVLALGEPSRTLASAEIAQATFDWRELSLTFNSYKATDVGVYVGTWGGQRGRFWVDDASLEDAGLQNLVRRAGCPLRVTSDDGAIVFEEGQDFEPLADPRLLDFSPRPSPELRLTPGSRLAPGQRLRLSGYHAQRVQGSQVSVCMSEPRLYEQYEATAAALAQHLPSRRFLLSMDEIRQGGTDLADQRRGLSMGAILADCVTRQQAILREHHPGATCYIWSDMLDPGHNGHGDYYQVDGDFGGAVDAVPHDLVIVCWWVDQCERSLRFFAERGFETFGAAYYDADDLAGTRRWLAALADTPRARGIMYTTWRNRWDWLAAFGDLVSAG